MKKVSKQALLYVADLTVPSVIVISGDFRCDYCRQRVSQVVSKISGLKEYTVDIPNKQVIARGDVKLHADSQDTRERKKKYNKRQHLPANFLSRTAWICH